MILIIIESSGDKLKKFQKIFGKEYKIVASKGHIVDLYDDKLSVQIQKTNDGFDISPEYTLKKDRKDTVKNLKLLSKKAESVILATDNDREGEAIAYHLCNVLKLKDPPRMIFNEITKPALETSYKEATTINMDIFKAQETRRILDRLIGYTVSPLLKKGLSAGRVQSVTTCIIKNKNDEISSLLDDIKNNPKQHELFCGKMVFDQSKINSTLVYIDKKNGKFYNFFCDIDDLRTVIKFSMKYHKEFYVHSNFKKIYYRHPLPPFTTSSLQQDASAKFKFSPKKTDKIAQVLYESGWITYLRTDSTNVSPVFVKSAKNYIETTFGNEYYKFKKYGSNKSHAHECIRPTDPSKSIEDLIHANISSYDVSQNDLVKLYSLIWKRAISAFMQPAKIEMMLNFVTIKIDHIEEWNKLPFHTHDKCKTIPSVLNDYHVHNTNNIAYSIDDLPDGYCFRFNQEQIVSLGFLIAYRTNSDSFESNGIINEEKIDGDDTSDEINNTKLFKVNQFIVLKSLNIDSSFTAIPKRFNEASLVKEMEKLGIGRPSTYSRTLDVIQNKKYVITKNFNGINVSCVKIKGTPNRYKEESKSINIGCEKNKLCVSDKGLEIIQFLQEFFPELINVKFTGDMEEKLDLIACGSTSQKSILNNFWTDFLKKLNNVPKHLQKNNLNFQSLPNSLSDKDHEYRLLNTKYGTTILCKWKKYKIDSFVSFEGEIDNFDINIAKKEYFKKWRLICEYRKKPIFRIVNSFGNCYLKYKDEKYFLRKNDPELYLKENWKPSQIISVYFNNSKNKNKVSKKTSSKKR